jgi:hypothetical protein
MSSPATPYLPASQPPATISDLEQIIANALECLRPALLNENITAAFPYLLPKGLRLRVQLEEDGRKKRSTAAASNWNPQSGEIVIYYEPEEQEPQAIVPSRNPGRASTSELNSVAQFPSASVASASSFASEEVTFLQIQQCCEALAEAEKAGKLFIAFKWFRDVELPKYKFDWTASPDSRQRVIAKVIESGAIETRRTPNPKSPEHPTTTVKLNRKDAPQAVSKRFNPIVVRGEPVSMTIMRDRGSID